MKTVPNDYIHTYKPVHFSTPAVKKLLILVHNSHRNPQLHNPQIRRCEVFSPPWDIHNTPLPQSLRDFDGRSSKILSSRDGGKLQGNYFPDTAGQMLI